MNRFLLLSLCFLLSTGKSPVRAQAGSLDPAYDPHAEGAFVLAVAVQRDGKPVVGGSFITMGRVPRNHLARLNVNGSLDAGFVATTNEQVSNVLVQPDGKVLIGGNFTTVFSNGNAVARNRIARLNADGSVESTATFDAGSGADGGVFSLELQSDGKILVGGGFTIVNGTARNRIARLNADGSLESLATFNPGTGVNGIVYTAAVQADGKILIGGTFSAVNGVARHGLARLNSDGSLESTDTFNPRTDPNSSVSCFAVQRDGKILIGGVLRFGGAEPKFLARLNADGSPESTATFNPGTGPASVVYSIAVQADGKILIGGEFSSVNGATRNRIARLNADGSLESTSTFNAGTGTENQVYSLGLQGDGKILLGGNFQEMNRTRRNYLARLLNDAATESLAISDPGTARWLRAGAAPEVSQVTFELSTNGGVTWSPLGAGTRISGGWQRSGLNLPANGSIRASGRTTSGYGNGASGITGTVAEFRFFPEITVHDGALTGPALSNAQVAAVDFGKNVQGTPATRLFTIANTGDTDLHVSSVTVPPGYTVLNLPALPLTIGINQSDVLQISLTALTVGPHAGSVVIASDDPDEANFVFPVTGEVFIPDPVSAVVSTSTTLNRQTGLREQTFRITNDTTAMVPAYNLIIRGLPAGVEVNNASETRADGSVVVYIRQAMPPRSSHDIVIEYYSANRGPAEINPQLSTEVILTPPDLTVPPGGAGLTVDKVTRLAGGEMLIEFASVPGRRYQIEYSAGGELWQTSLPQIRAAANRTQWIDRGLPRTDRHPGQGGSRFYRVREVAP